MMINMAESCEGINKELAEAATQLRNAGFMKGWTGQVSARCTQPDGYSVVIKKSGGKADNPEDYCHVDSKGNSQEHTNTRPSLVTRVHCAIYESCPDVQTIVQCRGVYADALATVLGEIPLSMETLWILKAPPIVLGVNALRSDTFGQYVEQMAVAVSRSLANSEEVTSAVCIPFFGMWVVGASVAEAVERTLALEHMAEFAYLRLTLASITGLPKPEFPVWFSNILNTLQRPQYDEVPPSTT